MQLKSTEPRKELCTNLTTGKKSSEVQEEHFSMDNDEPITEHSPRLALATVACFSTVLLAIPLPASAAVEGGPWVPVLLTVLWPIFSIATILFLVRIILTWFPEIPLGKLPYSLAVIPTEPLLGPTRKLFPPIGGVDISPIIWLAITTFLNEILLGPQGILRLLSQS
eukprot:CAMPEP_0184645478 /NCGR_PEP_ID=MMETSP0308-20130426/1978_1 /TAXON_ID=38269 /ORGANISM="Gloeochaete witrockiana, Strain SAG 46.84" /LENGTH=166 /DNA_ID=CAMNT_0027074533 /DNA_START=261 /DNA_END=761 /DNA_ORIENTATION=-